MTDLLPVFAAVLLFFMPPGAALIESALVRAKHSVDPAAKMLAQTALGLVMFWLCGAALALGSTANGLLGASGFMAGAGQYPATSFLITALAVLSVGALASGAGAERLSYRGAMAFAVLMSGVVSPIVCHWTWHANGLLASFGFVDQAGAATVFLTSGAAGLGLSLALGPRLGNRAPGTRLATVQSQAFPFLIAGIGLIWTACFGLALGRGVANGPLPALSLFKVLLSGAVGGVLALVLHLARPTLVPLTGIVQATVGGIGAVLGGLYGLDFDACALLALLGAAATLCLSLLFAHMDIDSGASVIPATLGGGFVGAAGAAFSGVGDVAGLSSALILQLTGAGLIAGWTLMAVFGTVSVTALFMRWRVLPDVERRGLSVGEHGMTTDVAILINQMGAASRQKGVWTHLETDGGSEFVQVAREFNNAVDTFRSQVSELKSDLRRSQERVAIADARAETATLALSEKDQKLDEAAREVSLLTDQLSRSLIALEGVYKIRDGLVSLTHRAFVKPIERLRELSTRAATTREPEHIEQLIIGAQDQSARLARALDDLLSYADALTGEGKLEDEQIVDLGRMLGDVRERFLGVVSRRNLAFKAVWEPPYDHMRGDPAALRKILFNLVDRAVAHAPDGGMVYAAIRPNRDGDFAVEVTDNGPAILPGDLASALDPFAPGGGADGDLSLALCKTLAERHGGQMTVRSRPDGGNRVTVTFPRERLVAAPRQA